MKSYTFSLLPALLSLFFFFSNAPREDQNFQNPIPNEKAQMAKSYELFTVNTDLAARSSVIAGGVYLDINRQALADLFTDRPMQLQLTLPGEEEDLLLDLHRSEIFTDDFVARAMTENGLVNLNIQKGAYYAGTLKGDAKSVITLSVFDDWVMGILSFGGKNYNLGPLDDQNRGPNAPYVLYHEKNHLNPPAMECHTEDDGQGLHEDFSVDQGETAQRMTSVVKVYLECDYKMFQDRGGNEQEVINYVTGLFNEMATLYANEQILTRISEIMVWKTQDPYPTNSSNAALNAFTSRLNGNFNGDLAHLLSTVGNNNGGIAWLDVLCSRVRSNAYSNISNSFQPVPTYSWSVEVITHEMGHNLGSRHTHSCSWGPGKDQALDNCRATEGGCAPGPAPTNGGTIMSYCHLTSYGINFQNGFGIEPGNLIRNKVNAAPCLEDVFDCFSKIPLEAGITYSGNTANGGARNFLRYNCMPGVPHRGNEIAHSFTAPVPGWAYINYSESAPERLDLFLMTTCNPDSCIKSWEGGQNILDSFQVDFGVEYVFVVDVLEDHPGGAYNLTISFPGSGCATTVTLTDGVTFNGNTADGATNFINYDCVGTQHQGKEIGHFFISPFSGDANVIFSESSSQTMNLFLASACNPDSCIQYWQGPNVSTTVPIEAGVPYYFIVDTEEPTGTGNYQLTVSIPEANNCICVDPNAQEICENFESFDPGALSPQAQCWDTHNGNSSEDGDVSTAKAASGTNSLEIVGDGKDVVMSLGNRISGKHILKFKINPELNANGFWRVYHTYTPGGMNNEVAFDVRMENVNGQPFAKLYAGNPNGSSATFPYFANGVFWSDFFVTLDFENDQAALYYAGSRQHTWPISNTRNGSGGIKSIAAINFYSDSPNADFAVDDVRFYPNEGFYCDESGAIFCDDFDQLSTGALSQQSLLWSTISGLGGAQDASVTLENAESGLQSTLISSGAPGQVWDNIVSRFGVYPSGRIKKSFKMYVPLAKSAYVGTLHTFSPNDTMDEEYSSVIEFSVYGTGSLITGGFLYTFNYPQDTWFDYVQLVDLDNDQSTIFINNVPVATFPFSNTLLGTGGLKQWAGMNFWAENSDPNNINNNNVRFYIDNVELFDLDLYLNVDKPLISVGPEAGSARFQVTSNTPIWATDEDAGWFSTTPASGAYDGMVTINYDENLGVESRTDRVRVIGLGIAPKYVDIVQAGADPFLEVTPDTNVLVSSLSGTLNFAVNSNVFWTSESTDTTWLKPVAPAGGVFDGTFSINYSENFGAIRKDTIVVTGFPAADIRIIVTQEAAGPTLEVDRDTLFVPFTSGTTSFEILANVNWTITDDASWISTTPDAGADLATITVNYDENTTINTREALITVSGDNGTGDRTIVVIQSATTAFMNTNTVVVNLPAGPAGSAPFEIDANVDWNLSEMATWFDLDISSGTGDGLININYDENPLPAPRTDSILITGSNGVSDITVVVNQAAAGRRLSASVIDITVPANAGDTVVDISANIDWFVSTDALWFFLNPATGGSLDGQLTITYDENQGLNPRTENIRLFGVGVPDIIITVTQLANAPYLTVNPETVTVGSDAGSTMFTISSNVNFQISDNATWLTTDRFNGSGNATVTASYSENNDPAPRVATITVTQVGGPLSATLVLTQSGLGAVLSVSPDTLRLPYIFSGPGRITVSSNVLWSVVESIPWLSTNPTSGFSNGSVNVNYFENTSSTPRTGVIAITSLGLPDGIVVVIQDGAPSDLSVTPSVLNLPATSGSTGIDIAGNVDWTVSADVPWLQFDPPSGTGATSVVVNYDANPDIQPRTGTITVEGPGGLLATVAVTQNGAQASINANPITLNVGAPAGSTTFDLTANIDWEISVSDTWLSVTPEMGTGNTTITVNYDENSLPTSRSATINISGVGVAIGRTVTVIQGAAGAILTLDRNNINVPAPSGNESFNITSNVDWDVTVDVPWIQFQGNVNGNGNAQIAFNYDENTDPASRVGTITVQGQGVNPQTITVTQSGAGAILTTSTTSINLTAPMGSTTFDVSSNINWSITADQGWLSVAPANGSGNGTITLNYDENTAPSNRTATLTVSGDNGVSDILITVVQEGVAAFLTVSQTSLTLNPPAGQTSVTISTNVSWTATASDTWLQLVPAMGTGSAALTINYDENQSTSSRMATITVSGPGVGDQVITVTQSGATVVLTVNPTTLSVAAPAGSTNVDITSNTSWNVTTNAGWFSVSQTAGTGNASLTVNYDENTGINPRSGTITISGTGVPNRVINITQAGVAAVLNASPTTLNVTAPAGSTGFSINSNTNWSLTTNAGWFTVSQANGSGDATIQINYDENVATSPRSGTITISGTGVPNQVVTITQAAAAAFLNVSRNIINVDAPAGNTNFTVASNVSWTVVSAAPWFSLSTNSGTGNGTVTITYTENTAQTLRTATILVSSAGLPDQLITLNQAGTIAAFLTVSPGDQTVNSTPGNQIFNINANVGWTVTVDAPWVNLSPSSGNGVGLFVASWSSNPNQVSRVANITVTGNGVPIVTVKITQAAFTPSLSVNPTSVNVGPSPGSVNVNLLSNVTWSVNVDEPWLSVSPNFGTGNATLTLNYQLNPTTSPRIANITISGGGAPDVTIVVNQSEGTSGVEDLETVFGINLLPNPVRDNLTVEFEMLKSEKLRVEVLSVNGQSLKILHAGNLPSGKHTLKFPVENLSNGIYMLRFQSEHGVLTKRFMVSK